MSLHINRFIDRVRSAEHRGQREFTMSMQDARDLQADLAKLLLTLHVAVESRAAGPDNTPVEIHGGDF